MCHEEIVEFADRLEAGRKSSVIIVADENDVEVKFTSGFEASADEAAITLLACLSAAIQCAAEKLDLTPDALCEMVAVAASTEQFVVMEEAEPCPVLC